jgi:hypothetical protein
VGDSALLTEISDVMAYKQRHIKEEAIRKHYTGHEVQTLIESYHAASFSLQLLAETMSEDSEILKSKQGFR